MHCSLFLPCLYPPLILLTNESSHLGSNKTSLWDPSLEPPLPDTSSNAPAHKPLHQLPPIPQVLLSDCPHLNSLLVEMGSTFIPSPIGAHTIVKCLFGRMGGWKGRQMWRAVAVRGGLVDEGGQSHLRATSVCLVDDGGQSRVLEQRWQTF